MKRDLKRKLDKDQYFQCSRMMNVHKLISLMNLLKLTIRSRVKRPVLLEAGIGSQPNAWLKVHKKKLHHKRILIKGSICFQKLRITLNRIIRVANSLLTKMISRKWIKLLSNATGSKRISIFKEDS